MAKVWSGLGVLGLVLIVSFDGSHPVANSWSLGGLSGRGEWTPILAGAIQPNSL